MSKDVASVWKSGTARQLAEVLAAVGDVPAMEKILRDILTEKEIIEISSRLEAARMLEAGETYAKIIAKTRLSSRTVARISAWKQDGSGGYSAALKQVHHVHASPVLGQADQGNV